MSGPARRTAAKRDPVFVEGILDALPTAENHGHAAVARLGGVAVTPWRSDHLEALAAGCVAVPQWAQVAGSVQALVRLRKGTAAVQLDLAGAWNALMPGGRLVISGPNDLGPASWIKRIAAELDAPPLATAIRDRSRSAAFRRDSRAVPAAWQVDPATSLFAGGGLDEGSAMLVASLADLPECQQILDIGAGAGHLAAAALDRWPTATATLVEADATAVAVASERTRTTAPGRATVHWWDVAEPLPVAGVDLVLCNPPCHAGPANDLAIARRMSEVAVTALRPGGRLRLVANRQLPYEAELAKLGAVRQVREDRRFKVLEVIVG